MWWKITHSTLIRVDQTNEQNSGCDPSQMIRVNQNTKVTVKVNKHDMGHVLSKSKSLSDIFPCEFAKGVAFFFVLD